MSLEGNVVSSTKMLSHDRVETKTVKISLSVFQEALKSRYIDEDYLKFNFPKSTNYLADGKLITKIFKYFQPQALTLYHHFEINIINEEQREKCFIKLTNEQFEIINNFPMK